MDGIDRLRRRKIAKLTEVEKRASSILLCSVCLKKNAEISSAGQQPPTTSEAELVSIIFL